MPGTGGHPGAQSKQGTRRGEDITISREQEEASHRNMRYSESSCHHGGAKSFTLCFGIGPFMREYPPVSFQAPSATGQISLLRGKGSLSRPQLPRAPLTRLKLKHLLQRCGRILTDPRDVDLHTRKKGENPASHIATRSLKLSSHRNTCILRKESRKNSRVHQHKPKEQSFLFLVFVLQPSQRSLSSFTMWKANCESLLIM